MSYTNHYTLLLSIRGMIDADGVDLTPEKVTSALRTMADRIEESPETMKEVIGDKPVATDREDRWVLRSVDAPNVIRKVDGTWTAVEVGDIDPADTLSSGEIAALGADDTADGVWVPPEDIGGLPVIATVPGPGGTRLGRFDLRNWLTGLKEEAIVQNIENGWDFTEAVEEAAVSEHNPLFQDTNRLSTMFGAESFEVEVEEADIPNAVAFLDELRPGLIDRTGARPSDTETMEP